MTTSNFFEQIRKGVIFSLFDFVRFWFLTQFLKYLWVKKPVPSFVRAQMRAVHDAAFNQAPISKQLNISRCCVQNVIKKYTRLGAYDHAKRSERPKELDTRGFRHLKRLAKGDERQSATKIASDLNANLPKPVTIRTVRTYLKQLAIEYVVKMKKQWLTIQHPQRQVALCTKYINWTSDNWEKVFFGRINVLRLKTKESI